MSIMVKAEKFPEKEEIMKVMCVPKDSGQATNVQLLHHVDARIICFDLGNPCIDIIKSPIQTKDALIFVKRSKVSNIFNFDHQLANPSFCRHKDSHTLPESMTLLIDRGSHGDNLVCLLLCFISLIVQLKPLSKHGMQIISHKLPREERIYKPIADKVFIKLSTTSLSLS